MDTIVALATAPLRAALALVRVSGSGAFKSAAALTRRRAFTPRRATLARLYDAQGNLLDQAVVTCYPGPHSFTGEDCVEYAVHGGRAVFDGVISTLIHQPGHRLAEPGEFTRRAFEAGRIDLTAAEAISDLTSAQTQWQRTQALHQLEGGLATLYHGWANRLVRILAHGEADLDFPDEDLPEGVNAQLRAQLPALIADIDHHLHDSRRGERMRDGFRVVILGPPNAGKSSLLNALAGRDAAIVSDIAGTTRDVIDVHLDIAGYPVTVSDTAGLRDSTDIIEQAGMERARGAAARADIILTLHDNANSDAAAQDLPGDIPVIALSGKADINAPVPGTLPVSSVTGQGIDTLLEQIAALLAARFMPDGPVITRVRHREALTDCRAALARAMDAPLPELMTEDIRLALRALGRITGRVDVEDLLDVIFRDFCIGK